MEKRRLQPEEGFEALGLEGRRYDVEASWWHGRQNLGTPGDKRPAEDTRHLGRASWVLIPQLLLEEAKNVRKVANFPSPELQTQHTSGLPCSAH